MRGAKPTIASLQYELLSSAPYARTSDELLFAVHLIRAGVDESQLKPSERAEAFASFVAKPQACLRASPLGKQYGWGIHHDTDAKVALYGRGTAEYRRLADDSSVTQAMAMRLTRQ
nr:DUF6157 family protein [Lysinibacter cavernae]